MRLWTFGQKIVLFLHGGLMSGAMNGVHSFSDGVGKVARHGDWPATWAIGGSYHSVEDGLSGRVSLIVLREGKVMIEIWRIDE
jgi:hypothetical protein